MTLPLSRSYSSRYGTPVLHRVDPRVFTLTYYGQCMDCSYCHDACCQFGADIEWPRVEALLAVSAELESYLGVPRKQWFRDQPTEYGIRDEPNYPGGKYTRTAVVPLPESRAPYSEEACVFLDPNGRGCRIHRFALERGVDLHELKPMICSLFPLSHADGELIPAYEFEDDSLVCTGPGSSLFRGARADLDYYFGPELVVELTRIERDVLSAPESAAPERVGAIPLAVLP